MSRRSYFLAQIIWVVIIVFSQTFIHTATAQTDDEIQAKQQKAQSSILIIQEQINRGLYPQAQVQIQQIEREYGRYLSDAQRQTLAQMNGEIANAEAERQKISHAIAQIDELKAMEQYAQALSLLRQIQYSPFLRKAEQQMVQEEIQSLGEILKNQQGQMQSLFNQSVDAYRQGDLVAARAGFVQVVESGVPVSGDRSPMQYIELIDGKSVSDGQPVQPAADGTEPLETELMSMIPDTPVAAAPAAPAVTAAPAATAAPTATAVISVQEPTDGALDPYLNEVRRQRDVQIGYTTAIVNDSLFKANEALTRQEFDAAREALRRAFATIERNKLLLGDPMYRDFSTRLQQMEERVAYERSRFLADKEKAEAEQAAQMTQQIRQTMEQQRAQAIESYMDRAYAFQDEQRYEEALGQLEQLLAIDPLNHRALILKKTLENTILWQEHRRVQAETDKEELELLLEASRRSIPYSKEINYPKNWKEIAARREQAVAETKDPLDAAVEQQLSEVVDLSVLSEEMTFQEALELLRTAVDPPLKIVVLWPDLNENAFIQRETPINISGQGLAGVPLRTALERLLLAVSSSGISELGYVIENGVITIATEESLPTRYRNVVYDVAELLNPPANFDEYNQNTMNGGMGGGGMGGGMMGGGMGGGQTVGNWQGMVRGYELMWVIQESVEPDSWYEYGGEGRIQQFGGEKLIVWQTPEVHKQIEEFLEQLKAGLGEQVAIESRFLLVSENFLEDIAIDMDIPRLKVGGDWGGGTGVIGDGINPITGKPNTGIQQDSFGAVQPVATRVPSSLGANANDSLVMDFSYGTALDDLQVQFLIRATQQHANARQLSAPKAMVLSGESATLDVTTSQALVTDSEFQSETITTDGGTVIDNAYFDRTIEQIPTTVRLTITPTITADKKYVLLRIIAYLTDLIATQTEIARGFTAAGEFEDKYVLPTQQFTSVQTRVSVPDRGTVLLGGLTLTAESEKEAGVPVLSKLPVLGRLFSNRSKVKDKEILLILVKPTIVLREESEADAVSALGGLTPD